MSAIAIDLVAEVAAQVALSAVAGGSGGSVGLGAVVNLPIVVGVVIAGAVGTGGGGGGGGGGDGGGGTDGQLICPVGAVAKLMAGAVAACHGGSLKLTESSGAVWVVASAAGRRMRFRSVESAARWVELVILRAASEIGLADALPAERRARWREAKLISLAGYQDRLIESAAKVAAGSAAQVAILAEYAAVQHKIDSL